MNTATTPPFRPTASETAIPRPQTLQRLAQLSPQKRALLEALHREKAARASAPRVEPRQPGAARGSHPLSPAQERLWLLHTLEPDSPAYNVPNALVLEGPLDHAALERTLAEIVVRHEVLRSRFGDGDDGPIQIVEKARPAALPVLDLSALGPARARDVALRQVDRDALRPFDLRRGPLLRARLFVLAKDEHLLLVTLHHIVSDAWSKTLLVRELGLLYPALVDGRPSPLAPLPAQVADLALRQRRVLEGPGGERLRIFWRETLGSPRPAALDLPTDRPRKADGFRGARQKLALDPALRHALAALARGQETTLFSPLMAAYQVLLHALSQQDDFAVGVNVAQRDLPESEPLIGFFLNMVVLRSALGGDPDFGQLVGRVRKEMGRVTAHQDLPFDQICQTVDRTLSQDTEPLFRAKIDYQRRAPRGSVLEVAGLRVRPLDLDPGITHADLSLFVLDDGQHLELVLEYRPDLFTKTTIRAWLDALRTVLEQGTNAPGTRLSSLVGGLGERLGQRHADQGRARVGAASQKLRSLRRRSGRGSHRAVGPGGG